MCIVSAVHDSFDDRDFDCALFQLFMISKMCLISGKRRLTVHDDSTVQNS